jgi:arylsulfatase
MAELTRRNLLASAAAPLIAKPAPGKPSRPNILLIVADQLRGDCIGADGNNAIRTPGFDRIAREGARFRCAYSSTPTCTPARCGLLTGMSPWHHGMLGYGKGAEKYPTEMPRLLREAGYYTLGVGKMHWHPQRNPHGFHQTVLDEQDIHETPEFRSDYYGWFYSQAPAGDISATGLDWNGFEARPYVPPEHLHPTRWTGETAMNFLKDYNHPEPFFLKVSFVRPHSPYDPIPRFWKMYENADLPAAKVGGWAGRYRQPAGPAASLWQGDLGAAQVRSSRQGYYGSVSQVDEQVGLMLDLLEKRRMLEQTLVIFTADHGDMTGDHHLWRKSYPYEASARIPMLVRWPEGLVSGARGQVRAEAVELRDVLATMLDAAGVPARREIDGGSLLGLVRGKTDGWRQWLDLEHDICYEPSNHWNALTDGHWKYIFHAMDGEQQLFNLDQDPQELRDLAGESASAPQVRLWRQRMIAQFAERGAPFLANGDLALRPTSLRYSPNFPK